MRRHLTSVPIGDAMDVTLQPPQDGGGTGGPPYNESMNERLEKLETFAKDAGERLVRIETVLSHVEKEVGQFKWWVVGQIVALFLAVIGTGVAIQQMTVASFQGAAQVARDAAPTAAPQPLPPIIINVPGQQPANPR